MVKARTFLYVNHFEGFPKITDLKIVEEELPSLNDGEYLCEAIYLSVDPYIRAYAPNLELGTILIGNQIAKVIESKNAYHRVGEVLWGRFGWRTHTICEDNSDVFILPDFEDLPLSWGLGILGMPGNTAYFGLLELCQPTFGEVVVVTGAGGAVGSIVGQIAKILGCTVIGIAGSDEKGNWLVNDLGFDHFLNYNDPNFHQNLQKITSDGVDCFFDNVGGQISSVIIKKMNLFGRVACCGSISSYNDIDPEKVSPIQKDLVLKQIKMEGFNVRRWNDRWLEGILQIKEWIKEGKLKYRETVTDGFDNMFDAFLGMLKGENIGKAVVKV